MPDTTYTLTDLSELADTTPRTVRYYIQQGLLPAPGGSGPGTRYSETHLSRLRLIKRLQREHLPLAEIRGRLDELDDATVNEIVARELEPPRGSALAYIRGVLGGHEPVETRRNAIVAEAPPPAEHVRSQWERIVLAPDVELHIRRPLTRHQNKQVERLIGLARQIFEGDQR